jgi:hypothetical protein
VVQRCPVQETGKSGAYSSGDGACLRPSYHPLVQRRLAVWRRGRICISMAVGGNTGGAGAVTGGHNYETVCPRRRRDAGTLGPAAEVRGQRSLFDFSHSGLLANILRIKSGLSDCSIP